MASGSDPNLTSNQRRTVTIISQRAAAAIKQVFLD